MEKESLQSIVVTGAVGFIGSNIVSSLNDNGFKNLILVDHLTKEKRKNLQQLVYSEYFDKNVFLKKIKSKNFPKISAIIHMGACSDTREYDKAYLKKNNYTYSQKLFTFASQNNCQFIYASSGAVYGDGKKGYKETLPHLKPLNPYGYYKYLFDKWVGRQKKYPKQWVGLRFFNVYGPHEEHKRDMASVVYHGFKQIEQTGKIRLFKSYKKDYKGGMQLRDFIYVKDVVDVILFFLKHPEKSGIFNVGTGYARSFIDVAKATSTALKKDLQIVFIPMPQALQAKYQYFTQADISQLQKIGYTKPFTSLEKGISEYVISYLIPLKTI